MGLRGGRVILRSRWMRVLLLRPRAQGSPMVAEPATAAAFTAPLLLLPALLASEGEREGEELGAAAARELVGRDRKGTPSRSTTSPSVLRVPRPCLVLLRRRLGGEPGLGDVWGVPDSDVGGRAARLDFLGAAAGGEGLLPLPFPLLLL